MQLYKYGYTSREGKVNIFFTNLLGHNQVAKKLFALTKPVFYSIHNITNMYSTFLQDSSKNLNLYFWFVNVPI